MSYQSAPVVSGVRYCVRKDTECPFLRNVISPDTQDDDSIVPNIDNTGPFVQRTTNVGMGAIPILREAFEIIGAGNPSERYNKVASEVSYFSIWGYPMATSYPSYQVLWIASNQIQYMQLAQNPCIKACEGFDQRFLAGRHCGFVRTQPQFDSVTTLLLYPPNP